MRVLAGVQPVYLPWLGYFEQIARADCFVVQDDAQYTAKNWRNRNRIYGANGAMWLIVPVKGHPLATQLREVEIAAVRGWQRRHLRAMELSYRRCRHFEPLFGDLAAVLESPPPGIAALDEQLIHLLCRHLGITTPIHRSSAIPRRVAAGDKNGRLLELCAWHGADTLYLGAAAAAYVDVGRLRAQGVGVTFQEYAHPVYRQRRAPFLSHLSAVDAIFNLGEEAAALVRRSPFAAALHCERVPA
jgi:hypothetical protein